MGRNPTLQHVWRLLFLAPDWTESNVRSMVKAIPGVVGREEAAVYQAFWGRVVAKAGLLTIVAQLVMAAMDDEEDFWSMYKRQWDEGRLRWLDVDITPIVPDALKEEGSRKFFSILGHFRDPIKFVGHPGRSINHKSSVLAGMVTEYISGEDWAGKRFTTLPEVMGIDNKGTYKTSRRGRYRKGDPKGGRLQGKLVTFDFSGGDGVGWSQLPSFAISQGLSVLPIQAQALQASVISGEIDAFDALMRITGTMTFTTYPEKDDE